jgi:hypothetical protein
VLVLGTLGAPERRRLRGRRGSDVAEAAPEPVPTARATVVQPEPFPTRQAAADWLREQRSTGAAGALEFADGVIRRALRSWRAAAADARVPDPSPERALVVRVGFGDGTAVAEGRFAEAWELPPGAARRRVRRSMEAPEERFAALLGARETPLAAEELVLRARSDLDAGRPREAALQARVALEALLAELPGAALDAERPAVGAAANAALRGELEGAAVTGLETAVERMEAALRAHRLR